MPAEFPHRGVEVTAVEEAAAGIGALPLDRKDFEAAITETLSADKLELNLQAYDMGVDMIQKH